LNVKADFSDSVSAFIELDSYDIWGEDFRSNYLTGVDSRASTGDDVEVYQAYIEAKEMWGTGLQARIGRQEIKWGSGWLLGTNDKNAFFRGLSFDAVRLTYATDQFSVEALWAKLVENSPLQEDGDQDLYGVYASYKGIENVSLDAYWLFVRDADATRYQNALLGVLDAGGNVVGWKPSVIDTHTIGLRGAGTLGAFDFEAEAAYQWVDWDQPVLEYDAYGRLLVDVYGMPLIGERGVDSDAWAGNGELGYTFDMNFTPRVFLGGAYFSGDDNDLPFDRLFSNWEYTQFYQSYAVLVDQYYGLFGGCQGLNDQLYANLSNFWTARAGVSVMPTESLKIQLSAAYLALDEGVGRLGNGLNGLLIVDRGGWPVVVDDDSDLGWEVDLTASYAYTSDLTFEVGYAHFFVGDALDTQVILPDRHNNPFVARYDQDDLDYFYFQTKLSF
jgi:hypothetical protein